MRHLIDSYIGAKESRMLVNFDDLSLVEMLAQRGQDALDEFLAYMNEYLPDWRPLKSELNALPVSHADWKY